ncbi:hypothetical protein FNF27_03810 [Cafeteria roenbergensis]|uniref:Uncharacterized protein n=3 Tax=Cafeteria roenbergensis TaxID=33653 RepID=A0A5A8ED54_CAFRO|nr:hypothetical protein FNF27_03810 [Cafeteria roenbergensis]
MSWVMPRDGLGLRVGVSAPGSEPVSSSGPAAAEGGAGKGAAADSQSKGDSGQGSTGRGGDAGSGSSDRMGRGSAASSARLRDGNAGSGVGAGAGRSGSGGAGGSGSGGGGGNFVVADDDDEGVLEAIDGGWAPMSKAVSNKRRQKALAGSADGAAGAGPRASHEWDDKAKLPHGVREVRRHLEAVDNVPLLVSLFTDARPDAVGAMLRIMQLHGEAPLTISSALRATSPALMGVSDAAFALVPDEAEGAVTLASPHEALRKARRRQLRGMRVATAAAAAAVVVTSEPPAPAGSIPVPGVAAAASSHSEPGAAKAGADAAPKPERALPGVPARWGRKDASSRVLHPFLDLAASLASLPAAWALPSSAPLPILLAIVRDARRGVDAMTQGMVVWAAASLAAVGTCVAAAALGLPQPLGPLEAVWLLGVATPAVALAVTLAPAEPGLLGTGRTPHRRVRDDRGERLWCVVDPDDVSIAPSVDMPEADAALASAGAVLAAQAAKLISAARETGLPRAVEPTPESCLLVGRESTCLGAALAAHTDETPALMEALAAPEGGARDRGEGSAAHQHAVLAAGTSTPGASSGDTSSGRKAGAGATRALLGRGEAQAGTPAQPSGAAARRDARKLAADRSRRRSQRRAVTLSGPELASVIGDACCIGACPSLRCCMDGDSVPKEAGCSWWLSLCWVCSCVAEPPRRVHARGVNAATNRRIASKLNAEWDGMAPLDRARAVGADSEEFRAVAMGVVAAASAAADRIGGSVGTGIYGRSSIRGATSSPGTVAMGSDQGVGSAALGRPAAAAVAAAVARAVESEAPWAAPSATWAPTLKEDWRRVASPVPALPKSSSAGTGGSQDSVIGGTAAAIAVGALLAFIVAAATCSGASPGDAAYAARALALLTATLSVVVASGALMWRASDLTVTRPWHNRAWVWVCTSLTLAATVIAAVSGGASAGWPAWVIALVWPVVVLFVAVSVRSAGAATFEKEQRRRRFDFDTKLGMHSPR